MNDHIMEVEPVDMEKKNSKRTESFNDEDTIVFGEEKDKCYWNDQEFTEGDKVREGGVTYRCYLGLWIKENGVS